MGRDGGKGGRGGHNGRRPGGRGGGRVAMVDREIEELETAIKVRGRPPPTKGTAAAFSADVRSRRPPRLTPPARLFPRRPRNPPRALIP